ncbi:MAG: ATP-binding protein [Pseudaminobacter sp.]
MSQVKSDREALGAYLAQAHIVGPDELLESASIAHELGNLIQIASSAVNIIARHSRPDGASVLEPVISGARTSLDRAGALVRQAIRPVDRPGRTIERVDVVQSLLEVRGLIQYSWTPKYRIEILASAGLPPVECTRSGLQGAILNLALNARDAMPDGGVILLEAVAIFQDTAEALVELRVSDNGVGMTPETMGRAFDPFFTTKSTGLGGVGLPMVKRFVQEAGGSVKIESEPGIGTTVMLRLPAIR